MKTMLPWVMLCAGALLGASQDDRTAMREANKAVVRREYDENLKKYNGNPDVLVLPGLVADRRTKQVHIVGEATGIGKDDPIEFFLIAEDSGRDYEALAFSFAKPSDIHKALEFVGLTPGRPVDYGKLHFWPKGERVFVTFKLRQKGAKEIRAESLVIDLRTGKPLPTKGLVFVGSILVETPDKPGTKVYAADAHEPKAIAANYNELTTVLDVPYQAPQSEVYRHQMANPEFLFPRGGLLDILMVPEYREGKKRVLDLHLYVESGTKKLPVSLGDLVFRLEGENRNPGERLTLNQLLETFVAFTEAGRDPFVVLSFADDLPVGVLRELCAILKTIDNESGIRIEAPPPGQLYYKAFSPNEEFRDREKRLTQPWELKLSTGDRVSGILVQIDAIWPATDPQPTLKIREIPVPNAQSLRKELDARGPGLPVILVYAPPGLTHGQLMSFVGPVLSTHNTIHVFVEHEQAPPATPKP
ncbi:MAG: YdjY domain-containing protein [Kiritimatiellae bacterium]|nr:YdjY domain-containing protein [Kiritimatiellia bacterium]